MATETRDRPCRSDDCGCVPAEFARLRYFYGQRLGVVDLNDAQAYQVGKHRFHNARLHGAGVVCGLRVDRYQAVQGAVALRDGTVLTVTRGAAIDACGREILVPVNQCIDINAWYAVNKDRDAVARWAENHETEPLWVCLKYRDCPSDPQLAPRDPCGCDSGGCEYARVRESFELSILTPDEVAQCASDALPIHDRLGGAFNSLGVLATDEDGPAGAIARQLKTLLAGDCPLPEGDECICLASFFVTMSGGQDPVVTGISDPDNATPQRPLLLSTGTMQALLLGLLAGSGDVHLPFAGPTLRGVSLGDPPGEELRVAAELVASADTDDPLVWPDPEVLNDYFKLTQFTANEGWTPKDLKTVAVKKDNGSTWISITVPPEPGFKSEDRYRLTYAPPYDRPIVDRRMRPLHPSPMAWQFRLIPGEGDMLVIADDLFEGEGQ